MLDSPLGAFFSSPFSLSACSLIFSLFPVLFHFDIQIVRSFSFAYGFFFELVDSIPNLHKYICVPLMHTYQNPCSNIASKRWMGYSSIAGWVTDWLTSWLAGWLAEWLVCLAKAWLAWENNCGLVEQRFHRKFPVNLFEFIYIFAAISLHKLLLNIPKLRNLFSFEWVRARVCLYWFRNVCMRALLPWAIGSLQWWI